MLASSATAEETPTPTPTVSIEPSPTGTVVETSGDEPTATITSSPSTPALTTPNLGKGSPAPQARPAPSSTELEASNSPLGGEIAGIAPKVDAVTADEPISMQADAPVLLEVVASDAITWDVRATTAENSPLIGGAAFNLRNNAVPGTVFVVPDCTAAPCTGYDSDPTPGVFNVANGATDVNGANPVVMQNNQQWRFQPTALSFWEYNGTLYQFTTLTTNTWYPTINHSWTSVDGVARSDLGNVAATPLNTAGNMTVIIRKRVLADPTGLTYSVSANIGTNYSYTEGARFRLYTNVNGEPGAPLSAGWASCEVPASSAPAPAAAGQCTIVIPGAAGGLTGQRFWVVEESPRPGSPAANTYSNDRLYLGDYNNPQDLRRLVGLTTAVASNSTIYMPMTGSNVSGGTVITTSELPGTAATVVEAGSFGAMANSYKNPAIEPKCAPAYPNIAIVIDGSSSIAQEDWATFRTALVGTGTNSVLGVVQDKARVSILTFGPSARWNYGSTGPVLVNETNRSGIAGTVPVNRPALSGTNWDAGLSTIQSVNTSHDYDLVLFVTDGAPNAILGGVGTIVTGTSGTSGYQVALRALEAPAYAANALKSSGVRVVAVGVGDGANTDQVAANLRAVSGETKNKDYFQGAWSQLNAMLADVVKAATCTVPIEVSKTTVEGTNAPVPHAGGWNFSAGRAGDGTLISPTPANGTTIPGGSVKWDLNFTATTHSADLTLTENPTGNQTAAGWILAGVTCTVDGVDRPVTVVNGSVTVSGLGPASGKVSCVFTNTKAQVGALSIEKAFSQVPVGSGSVPFSGTYACELGGNSVSAGTWSKTGAGAGATMTTTSGSPHDKLPAGASCTVEETAIDGQPLGQNSQGLPSSSWVWGAPIYEPASVNIAADLTANVVVTNTAQLVHGAFSITKVVVGTADEGLEYGGKWRCVVNGGEPVSGDWLTTAGETWTSPENANIPLGAECEVADETTRPEHPVADDHAYQWDGDPAFSDPVEAVKAGENVALGLVTVTNKTKRELGSVTWTKVDSATEALLAGSAWWLTGPNVPADTKVVDCTASPCGTGPYDDRDAAAGQFLLADLLWGDYTLVEAKAPPGYLLDNTEHAFTIGAGNLLNLQVGPIDNTPVTPPTLPLTGGLGRDFYTLLGLGVIGVTLGATGFARMKARRDSV